MDRLTLGGHQPILETRWFVDREGQPPHSVANRMGTADMIVVSRLNGEEFGVNAEHIERVEETPDTVLTLLDGKKYIVRESLNDVLDRVIAYRAQILRISYSSMPTVDDDARLRLVPSSEADGPFEPEQGGR